MIILRCLGGTTILGNTHIPSKNAMARWSRDHLEARFPCVATSTPRFEKDHRRKKKRRCAAKIEGIREGWRLLGSQFLHFVFFLLHMFTPFIPSRVRFPFFDWCWVSQPPSFFGCVWIQFNWFVWFQSLRYALFQEISFWSPQKGWPKTPVEDVFFSPLFACFS